MKRQGAKLLEIKKIIRLKVKSKARLAHSGVIMNVNSHSGSCPVAQNVLPMYPFCT